MQETNEMRDRLINEFAENYMEKLFYFCLKKTGNNNEAEDLTQDIAREFGKRSYNPEQIAFVQNGRDGKKGQPWSIITHLLYKNIFLETYENPQTAEALALELGIALPYMEDELEFLTREQLLTKNENKYQTAFKIISKEEQRKKHDNNKKIQKPMADKICELIDTYIVEDGSKVNYDYVGYTLWLVCSGRTEACEKSYLEKLLEYGYLKKDGAILPNVVIFDRNAEKTYNEQLSQKLTSLKDDIYGLFKQAPDIERGYIVEQAILDGWLKLQRIRA